MDALNKTFNDFNLKYENGESSAEAMKRGAAALQGAKKNGECPLIVTHGNLLTLIMHSIKPEIGFDFWKKLKTPHLIEMIEEGSEYSINKYTL